MRIDRYGWRSTTALVLAAAITLFPFTVAAVDRTSDTGTDLTLSFGGVDYVHRWSNDGQSGFTPQSESSPGAWHDMITINLYPGVGNGEQLASLATTILRNYERAGEIIRTNTKPGTSERAAEHIIVALLGGHAVLQVAFARLSLIDDVGVVTVYSHREYGEAAYNKIREWLENNGPSVEIALMTWDKMPALATLQELTRNE